MDNYFSNLFQIIYYERLIKLVLSLTDPDILRESKFTNHEIDIMKNLAPEKVRRQRTLKEYIALDQLEKQFSD